MTNLALQRMNHTITCALFMFALAFCALPVLAGGPPSDKEKEWEECYYAQWEKNGANACLDYCKVREGYTDVDLDDRLQACHEQQGCMYYVTLADYQCQIKLYGESGWKYLLDDAKKRYAIPNEQLEQWKSR